MLSKAELMYYNIGLYIVDLLKYQSVNQLVIQYLNDRKPVQSLTQTNRNKEKNTKEKNR